MLSVLKALFLVSILVLPGSLIPVTFAQNSTLILLPLKQLKNGTSPQDVKCKEGFVLVIKTSDSFPACVKPTSVYRLLSQNWVLIHNKIITLKGGEKDGPLLVQNIFTDHIFGLNYKALCKPLQMPPESSVPVTLHLGETANDDFGNYDLTLIKIHNGTAVLLKIAHTPKPCALT